MKFPAARHAETGALGFLLRTAGHALVEHFAWVGHSHFPCGGGVPTDAGQFGKVYVGSDGTLVVDQSEGIQEVSQDIGSTLSVASETRTVLNECGPPATVIAITRPVSQ